MSCSIDFPLHLKLCISQPGMVALSDQAATFVVSFLFKIWMSHLWKFFYVANPGASTIKLLLWLIYTFSFRVCVIVDASIMVSYEKELKRFYT